ncbi:probable xyloglucan endotransglucosylase hydrolase 8, partial [Olea europaea subsp. europaea]
MRHMLWCDPTEEFDTHSILWNSNQILFFLVKVLYKNANYTNIFFPQEANLLISRIWNGMTRLQEETDPKKAPFESFHNPTLQCVSTTTKNQWE